MRIVKTMSLHSCICAVIRKLARAHHAMGHGDKGIHLMRQSLAIKKDCLPSDHPSIARGLTLLVQILQFLHCIVYIYTGCVYRSC